jgi:hypothetical protein
MHDSGDKSTNDEVDNLHIPHIGFLQWYSDKDTISFSMNDKSLREIGVRFYLEDLRAGTEWVHLKFKEDMSQSIEYNGLKTNFWFEKNNKGYFQSIFVGLTSAGCIEAFKESTKFINGMLSTLCFFYRRPMKIGRITIEDKKHNAQISTRKSCPASENLIAPLATFKSTPIGSLFAIYRDGMNSVDLAYRYICFFKIYEAWKKYPERFFNKKNKISSEIFITKNLLAGSYRENYHQNFLDKLFNDEIVYENLNHIRNYLVHPVIDRGIPASFYNLDEISTLETMESMSNLVERMVTKILDIELNIMSEDDSDIAKLIQIFNHDNQY